MCIYIEELYKKQKKLFGNNVYFLYVKVNDVTCFMFQN